MNKPLMKALRWYYHLFSFIAAKRLQKGDLDVRSIHGVTVTVLSTGVLMWSYAVLAYTSISSPIPGIVGFACAIFHLLSPLLFRLTNRHFLICNIILTSGIIHQSTFSFFTGGFMSVALKWLPILPLLAGVISGRKGAITWGVITFLTSLGFVIAHQNDFAFPNLITEQGLFFANVLLQFGFILVSTIIIFISVSLQNNYEGLLQDQKKKIDDLFKVLFHDLANPLGRLGIGLNVIKKQTLEPQVERGVEIISQASESMMEITQSVRKMYAISKGKADIDLIPTSLNDSILYLQQLFKEELTKKQISIEYNFEKNQDLKLLVEPTSFKNQVLGNIFSNAIKFSHPGGKIHVGVECLKHPLYSIEIRDEGVGIPQSLLPHLFDFNRKTNRSGTSGEKGTGFGLQIMKSFIEMYGGAVSIKSTEGSKEGTTGTSFTLTLLAEK